MTREKVDFYNYKNREKIARLLGWYDRNCVPFGVIKHEVLFDVFIKVLGGM